MPENHTHLLPKLTRYQAALRPADADGRDQALPSRVCPSLKGTLRMSQPEDTFIELRHPQSAWLTSGYSSGILVIRMMKLLCTVWLVFSLMAQVVWCMCGPECQGGEAADDKPATETCSSSCCGTPESSSETAPEDGDCGCLMCGVPSVPAAETATSDRVERDTVVAMARAAHPNVRPIQPLSDTNRAVFRPPDPPAYLVFEILLI